MNSTLRTAGNISRVLVAKCAAAHGLADGASVTAGLADGVVAVVRPDMTVVAMTGDTILGDSYITALGEFRIVQGTGVGEPLRISPLYKSGEYTLTGNKYAIATEQISYVGFNGTAGTLDGDDASTSYYITLIMNNPNEADRSQPRRIYGQYTTPATGQTNSITTLALAENLVKNFSVMKDDKVKIERVNSGTNTAVPTGAATSATIIFTKGSKTVTGFANVDDATTTAVLAVGELLRIGTTDDTAAIASINTTTDTLELDTAFQGETVTLNDTGLERVTVANLGTWGIKLTGVNRSFDVAKNRNNYKVRFTVNLSDSFNATGITTSQKAFEGLGMANQVAMDYYEGSGFNGQNDLIGVPPGTRDAVPTAITAEYGAIRLAQSKTVSSVVSSSVLNSDCIIYLEYSDGSTGGTDGDVSANGESIVGTTATYDA